MKKTKIRWRFLLGFIFFFLLCMILFYLYINGIHFAGKIHWIPNNAVQQIETTSPLNKKQIFTEYDKTINGYFKEITLFYKAKGTFPLVYQIFDGKQVFLKHRQISANTYQLIYPEISITQKIKAVVSYNKNFLAEITLLLTFLLFVFLFIYNLFQTKKKYHQYTASKDVYISKQKVFFTKIIANFARLFEFIKHQKYSILAAAAISLAVYPCLLYCFGIDFSTIYNASHNFLFIVISILSFVPLSGLFLRNKSHYFGLGFFAFWLIFLLHYFIISPFLFAGNFGFHGAFQDFLMVSVYENFFHGLFVPDVGYLAILPRIAYGFSILLSPDASQSIAITSIISLACYSFIFCFLAGNKFKFLWPSPKSGFIFIILLAVIPVFSLVPSINFYLPITDTAYYGLVFSFYVLFIINDQKTPAVYLLTIINCIFILSKAHFLVIFPVYLIGLFVFYHCRNRKGIILTLFSLIALIGQGVFCYLGMLNLQAKDVAIGSFSLQSFSISDQIIMDFAYFTKSYIHLLMPFINSNGTLEIIPVLLMFLFIIFLLTVAVRMIINKKNNQNLISLWFLTGNAIAFLSTAFYIYTLPENHRNNTDSLLNIINSTDVNLMRYTIGVHTILAITVVPFILYLFSTWFKRISQKYAEKMVKAVLFTILSAGIIFNYAPSNFMHFWSMAKGDKWSYEWKQLVPLIKNKTFYIPVVFYPAYKQMIKTDNLEVAEDIIPRNASGFSLKEKKQIHAVIVLNSSDNKLEEQTAKTEIFYGGKKTGSASALYATDSSFRFTYFLLNSHKPADSISFVNHLNQPAKISTHIRIVSYKNYANI